jgi:hypothetical protein
LVSRLGYADRRQRRAPVATIRPALFESWNVSSSVFIAAAALHLADFVG